MTDTPNERGGTAADGVSPDAAPAVPPVPSGRDLQTTVWVNSTYFAEGFPYMIVRYMSFVFYTDMGVRELYIGFLNFLGIPWNLKFLWAPFLDVFATKRRWLLGLEASVVIAIGVIAIFSPTTGAQAQAAPVTSLEVIVFILAALAFLSATHDVAIDAYYLACITDKTEQARYTGDRVLSYRIAVIYVRSVLVAAAALIGWKWSWGLAALTMGAMLAFHSWYLPERERSASAATLEWRKTLQHFVDSFRSYLKQPRTGIMLAFIATYKLGDDILNSMYSPFLLRGLGVTKAQLSWVAGILGTAGLITGSMLAAWYLSKVGLKRAIWPLTLLMNLNIWAYIGLAYFKPDPTTTSGIAWIAAINAYEQWAIGMGNASLLVYLLRTCKPEYKAGHYAVGSALMSIGMVLFGGFAGIVVEHIGYVGLFLIAFFATIPSMLLIPWIPYLDGPEKAH